MTEDDFIKFVREKYKDVNYVNISRIGCHIICTRITYDAILNIKKLIAKNFDMQSHNITLKVNELGCIDIQYFIV